MSDVKCPYCGEEQEINHDDGYGYEEDGDYEQECEHCEKTFNFTTSISFSYDVYCLDGEHEMKSWGSEHPDMWGCKKCDFYELRRSQT